MLNGMKLLTGPKVTLEQIRSLGAAMNANDNIKFDWPKAGDFAKHDVKNIVFDMEAVQNPFDKFGVRDIAGPMRDIWDKWQLNQQFGRFGRPARNMVIDPAGFFDARPREFEGVVCQDDMVDKFPEVANPFLRLKVPKDRDHAQLAFKMGDFKNVRILPDADLQLIHHIKPRTVKLNPVAALKAFWKDAQGVKPGIGYGHPALKGLIHGRKREALPPMTLEPVHVGGLRSILDGFRIDDGLFGAWQNMFKPDPHLNTEQREAKRIEQLERDARLEAEQVANRKESNRKRKLKTAKFKKIYEQLANDILRDLNKPGVDVAKRIAWFFSEVRYYGNGRMHTAVQLCTERLKEQGFSYLGEGCWSNAYLGPDGWVYKVNCNSDSLDGWFAYAVNVKLNGSSKNFPKIDKIARMGTTYCAKIERLEPLTQDEQTEFRDRNAGKMQAFRDSHLSTIKKEFGCNGDDAINLFEVVRDTHSEINGTYDIHPGNVMWRVENDVRTLVLTDPLCGGNFSMDTMGAKLAA